MAKTRPVQLQTLEGCELAIGGYPHFRYNACGGGATGTAQTLDDGRIQLHFPSECVTIPSLNSRTTRFLGLPLPPGLQITIHPERLAGLLDPNSGALSLEFRSRFRLQIGRFSAPDLLVETTLSTGAVQSRRHHSEGQPLRGGGPGLLVGAATIAPCGAAWLDRFLGLPDEALAVLRCSLQLEP
jgi:hypothetical protein